MSLTLTPSSTNIVTLDPASLTINEAVFQKMPAMTEDQATTLKADIEANGVKVPVEVTEDGTVLDGHNRVQIAKSLGITGIPAIVRHFSTEADAVAHIFAVNLQRRHLNQADRKRLVKEYLLLNPYASDRQVAADLGGAVTDKTVGAHRKELEEAGTVEKTEKRKGKDGKVRSATKAPRGGKGVSSDRQKKEEARTRASYIRLGVSEAAKVLAKGFTLEDMMGAISGAAKQREILTQTLPSVIDFYMALAASLGIEGYEMVATDTEDAAPEAEQAPSGDANDEAF